MPAAVAVASTGEGWGTCCFPRPLGLPGCEITAMTCIMHEFQTGLAAACVLGVFWSGP